MPKRDISIFDSTRDLKPSQINTVAQRRFEDAMFLLEARNNARLNAAMYLGGFVIECLLQAGLLARYETLGKFGMLDPGRDRIRSLVYRSHDLELMLYEMPEMETILQKHDHSRSNKTFKKLKAICSLWTAYARYSPYQANRRDAQEFLDDVKEIKQCLSKL